MVQDNQLGYGRKILRVLSVSLYFSFHFYRLVIYIQDILLQYYMYIMYFPNIYSVHVFQNIFGMVEQIGQNKGRITTSIQAGLLYMFLLAEGN